LSVNFNLGRTIADKNGSERIVSAHAVIKTESSKHSCRTAVALDNRPASPSPTSISVKAVLLGNKITLLMFLLADSRFHDMRMFLAMPHEGFNIFYGKKTEKQKRFIM
jgi:hypothetical protein